MSDNPTQGMQDPRSFEERVFARFDALDARMDRLETKVDGLDSRLSSVEGRLSSVEDKVDKLDARLTTLEEKVDTRLRETRPIWEAVLTQLGGIEARLDVIETEVKELRHGVELLHEDNLRIRIDQRETRVRVEALKERVEKLESKSTS